jgi:hypothetical protein
MKLSFIITISLLTGVIVFAQDNTTSAKVTGSTFINPVRQKAKPLGSPYSNLMFGEAKVNNIISKYYMRYDIYDDVFEFITPKNDTLILDKIDDFNSITFTGTKKKYKLTTYTNNRGKFVNGYLVDFYTKDPVTLFKKENVAFYEEKIAKTSLETSMPAKFIKTDDSYYFTTKEHGIVEFPESKKQLIKLFPDKKTEIETFLKATKISFNDDADRIKIIDFIATL